MTIYQNSINKILKRQRQSNMFQFLLMVVLLEVGSVIFYYVDLPSSEKIIALSPILTLVLLFKYKSSPCDNYFNVNQSILIAAQASDVRPVYDDPLVNDESFAHHLLPLSKRDRRLKYAFAAEVHNRHFEEKPIKGMSHYLKNDSTQYPYDKPSITKILPDTLNLVRVVISHVIQTISKHLKPVKFDSNKNPHRAKGVDNKSKHFNKKVSANKIIHNATFRENTDDFYLPSSSITINPKDKTGLKDSQRPSYFTESVPLKSERNNKQFISNAKTKKDEIIKDPISPPEDTDNIVSRRRFSLAKQLVGIKTIKFQSMPNRTIGTHHFKSR